MSVSRNDANFGIGTLSGSRSYGLGAYPFSGVTRGLDPRVHPLRNDGLRRLPGSSELSPAPFSEGLLAIAYSTM